MLYYSFIKGSAAAQTRTLRGREATSHKGRNRNRKQVTPQRAESHKSFAAVFVGPLHGRGQPTPTPRAPLILLRHATSWSLLLFLLCLLPGHVYYFIRSLYFLNSRCPC